MASKEIQYIDRKKLGLEPDETEANPWIPHTDLIPPVSATLPVRPEQKQLIDNVRQALGIPELVSDEQINHQLSWAKHRGYASYAQAKDHLRMVFLSDEGVATIIKAAEEKGSH